ncbi:hypothetical protein CPJCM30710_17260 [Clostridium polyendosporum]|uniref:DUF2935 domain-containing protein n=1 Tax=Clostridium polyendosporum TaxID=69208 RepID=A0A919RYU8_9CLOT|nr:DUF2935 domain-containing protein [Clostridium polyendosporum]GIM29060.1 hypothetical protein CPJCM30710_17260 [Clostridium polyendosporum]
MDTYNQEEILFEHRFWLQILGDHARFLSDALSSTEVDLLKKSNYFKDLFDSLLDNARKQLHDEKLNELTNLASNAAQEIRCFKLFIIAQQICGKVKINLPPTFINHMVNEVEEYLYILNCYMGKYSKLINPIYHHLLWLPDGSGHASSIIASLDMTEKELIKISKKFEKTFNDLYLRAIEFKGYMRSGLFEFPALDRLNECANIEMMTFKQFLQDLKLAVIEKRVLGALNPLAPDHMYREECYYQTKLSQVSKVKAPECDPTKERIKV